MNIQLKKKFNQILELNFSIKLNVLIEVNFDLKMLKLYKQKNLFPNHVNYDSDQLMTKFWLQIRFSDWVDYWWNFFWFQLNRIRGISIQIWLDSTRFRNWFPCVIHWWSDVEMNIKHWLNIDEAMLGCLLLWIY